MSEGCVFCDQSWMRAAEIFIETPHCVFASTRDPDIRAQAGLAEGVLPGSGAIVPIAHRQTDGPTHGRRERTEPSGWRVRRALLHLADVLPHIEGCLSGVDPRHEPVPAGLR
jgi:hypothetical protein